MKENLYPFKSQRTFPALASEAAFLLGGIGTGNISIGARGDLRDWEIFNHPKKGYKLPYSFFSLWIKQKDKLPVCKILESQIQSPYSGSHGFVSGETAGLPHIDSSSIKGEYPFVWVDFKDIKLPVRVQMEAFTPFIPLNADDSGIPSAIIRYKIKNVSNKIIDVSVAGTMMNAIGLKESYGTKISLEKSNKNEYIEDNHFRGIFYTSPELEKNHLRWGSMALTTTDSNISCKPEWLSGGWYDGIQDFWDDFNNDGKLESESVFNAPGKARLNKNLKVGSLGIHYSIKPKEEKIFEFVITWYFPNRMKGWYIEDIDPELEPNQNIVKNYYATKFSDAWDTAKYLHENLKRLEKYSRDFHRALFSSTLPWYVIDAVASNITVIRSPTCFRIEDGTFLAWEGCNNTTGSCEGSCTHVWGYAQTLAFLFPKLEQTMRRVEFNLETDKEGNMAFRTYQIFGLEKFDHMPAVDGQMSCIIRLFRDWKLSGDDEFLKSLWNKASKALDFAFTHWDSNGDYVLDREQHNTYDIEFFGPNSLSNSMFLVALKAGAKMAEYLEDQEHAKKYQQAWEQGSQNMDQLLWNSEYYIQDIENENQYRYQYGKGCLSDQLIGQYHAHVTGLGYILPKDHVKKAIKSVFKYNFKTDFTNHCNVERTYVLNDEKGLLLCSWPHGGRPRLPFVYSDEVWTGIEYQVASHLIYEGYIADGLMIVKAVRERQDGFKRNPWNEVECGHHYARSLSSWAVLLALSGFRYDMVKREISFAPKINQDNFSCFFSTAGAWGIYHEKKDPKTGKRVSDIEVLYGNLDKVKVNGK